MLILKGLQIKYYVKDRLLIDIDDLQVYQGDRIGLIGPNGCGKTTLMNILSQTINSHEGSIIHYSSYELIPQLKEIHATKSGGELASQYILDAIKQKPELILADEPTNNLDTSSIETLEKVLDKWNGAFIIVSHDRKFLDSLCTKIWELDEGKLNVYPGNYSDYLEQKKVLNTEKKREYEKYVDKKRQLELALSQKEEKAQRATKKPKNISSSELRITGTKTYYASKQKKLHQSSKAMRKRIEQLPVVEKERDIKPIQMQLANEEGIRGKNILQMIDIEAVINNDLLWRLDSFYVTNGDKIALIGDIATGKTTFIKKIVNKEKGVRLSPAVKIGYFSQNLDILNEDETILENVSSTSIQDETLIRIVLARLGFRRDDVYKEVKVLSGGERVKVALAKLFISEVNFLILDEPTNNLDIESVQALEDLLNQFNGTILLVSHDRNFIESIADRIIEIKHMKVNIFDGNYKQFKTQKSPVSTKQRKNDDKKLLLELKISEVLSRLSMDHSKHLEEEYQSLLEELKNLE